MRVGFTARLHVAAILLHDVAILAIATGKRYEVLLARLAVRLTGCFLENLLRVPYEVHARQRHH